MQIGTHNAYQGKIREILKVGISEPQIIRNAYDFTTIGYIRISET